MRNFIELILISFGLVAATCGVLKLADELRNWPVVYVDARTGECVRVETAEGKSGSCAELPARYWTEKVTRGR